MFFKKKRLFSALGLILAAATVTSGKNRHKLADSEKESSERPAPILWQPPGDLRARNLYFGPGGQSHAPHSTFTFEKEDHSGTSPKFIVRDENGVRWKVKMGYEARPETVADRMVWAAGYKANEDYFLSEIHVEGMPGHLSRGQQFIHPSGTANNVRLKRYLEGEKKTGDWSWQDNPFSSTRELNGLRVIMALINNWDTKNDNNSVYRYKRDGEAAPPAEVYLVSDLGATFGTTGLSWTRSHVDGKLAEYRKSKFILKVTPDYVDFAAPSRPFFMDVFDPWDFFMRVHMRWIGRRIPRSDVHWIGQLLAQLSQEQIRDAFRAAGYSPEEVDGFASVVEQRIAALEKI